MIAFSFGLVGHPVKHSMSPVMHEASFRSLRLPYRFGLFDVPKDGLEDFVFKAKKEMLGLNVTVPHKVSVIPFLDSLSKEAELIGAVNTVKFKGGRAFGFNTDGVGAVEALREKKVEVKGKRVLLLGAGGAARAIGFQMALEGAELVLANRTGGKAEELAREITGKTEVPCRVITFNEGVLSTELRKTDVLINATSVGMHPDETIIPAHVLYEGLTVMDVVYNPLKTRLLKEAEKKGCRTIDGVGMLVHQGASSERIWLGVEPSLEVMRKAVYESLREFSL